MLNSIWLNGILDHFEGHSIKLHNIEINQKLAQFFPIFFMDSADLEAAENKD